MRITFVSLFPEQIRATLGYSITGRAIATGRVEIETVNPRDFTDDPRKTVDDKPFGGGPGMLMLAEPLARAIESTPDFQTAAIVVPEPTGPFFSQEDAHELAGRKNVIFVCGHYEGIDERFLQAFATHRFSIGDYVLTGGELPSLVIADAVIRLIPGALGDSASLEIDSFADGLLSAPQYTRPETWRDKSVPEVLLSGDHKAIEKWKRSYALKATRERRPDLFALAKLRKGDYDEVSSIFPE